MIDPKISRSGAPWRSSTHRWRAVVWGVLCALGHFPIAWSTTLFQTSQVASGGQTIAGSSTLQPASAITVEAWITASSAQTNYPAFVSYGIDTTPYESYILQAQAINGTKPPDFYFLTGTGQGHQIFGTTSLQAGTQYHIAATYDGTSAKIYVNGQLQNTLAVSGSLYYPSGGGLGLARKYSATSANFSGSELGVAIYDTALTAAQILAHYQATSPPTTPSGLGGTATSSSQINLSWTASTDDVSVASYAVERCQGAGCSSFAQVGTSTTTSFSDAGLSASTSYSYRVRALDGSSNYSNYSNTASATTQASGGGGPTPIFQLAPVPAGGQTQAASSGLQPSTAITVAAWVKATTATTNYPSFVSYGIDTTPYESYILQAQNINGAKPVDFYFLTGTGTSHQLYGTTLLQVGTQYFLAATYDGTTISLYVNGQLDKSGAASGTLYYPSGGGLGLGRKFSTTSSAFSGTEAAASIYNSALTAAQVLALYQAGPPSGSTRPPVPNGYATSVTYTYDSVGRLNTATYSNSASITYNLDAAGNRKVVTTPDTTAPTAPGAPTFTNITATGATASWTAGSDNVGVASYEYEINSGAWVNVGAVLTTGLTGLNPSTTYSISVRAKDAAGNPGSASTASLTTIADTTAPVFTGALSFTNIAISSVTVNWPAASDNVAVTSYEYQVGSGTWINVGNVLSTSVTGLQPSTAYTVSVHAKDAAGNTSSVLTGSFITPSDTTPPGAPGVPVISNLVYNGGTATWTAASDNVGVTNYQYEILQNSTVVISWTPTGNVVTTSFTGLAPVTSYTFSVRALDAALNPGPSASAAFITAPDTTKPSPPGAPNFSAITDHSATATWAAATDNVGVTSYQYQVGTGGAWVPNGNSTSANLTGLAPATAYQISARALDAAGNISDPSSSTLTTGPDVTAPTAPGTPMFSSVTGDSAVVSWTAASDNVAVTNYQYQVNGGSWISVGTALSVSLTGLTVSTNYTVSVRALDARSNIGPSSTNSFPTLASITDVITVTSATLNGRSGYLSGSLGSVSPTTTSNGLTLNGIYNQNIPKLGSTDGTLQIGGFASDPGTSWLVSIQCGSGATFVPSGANYGYTGAPQAQWVWTNNPLTLPSSGATTCTIVHK